MSRMGRLLPLGQIEDVVDQLRRATAAAELIWRKTPPERLSVRPSDKSWSAVECVEHLNLTSRAFLTRLEAALSGAPGLADGAGSYRQEIVARLLRWWLEPPSRVRLPTTAPFLPVVSLDVPGVLDEFVRLQERLMSQAERARGLAIDQVSVQSPFAANVHYNCYSAFLIVAAHERRHLWQARRAIEK